MLSVRVFFKKKGALSYISHLDLNRTVLRALQRSKLPIVYSEGFNPHPRLVFTQPLSLFQESETEIFEFKLEQDIPYEEIKDRLIAALPPALEVTKVAAPVKKLSEIAFAEYELSLSYSDSDKDVDVKDVEKLLEGSIVVTKKTKKSESEIDITPMIKSLAVKQNENGISIKTVLDTSSDKYLNPVYITDYLVEKLGFDEVDIMRTKLFDSDMQRFE